MKIRNLAASAAMLSLLAACSKAPEAEAPVADTADAAHADHDATGTPALPRTSAPEGAEVFFDGLKDGDTVSSPVKVVFGVKNIAVAPAGEIVAGAGHHHLIVDADLPDPSLPIPNDAQHLHYGKAQTEAEIELPPGQHTLQLVMGDHLHIPFEPVVASPKITITVK